MKKYFIIFIIGLTFLTSCVSFQSTKSRRESYISSHPELSKQTVDRIRAGKIAMGMTFEEVRASWGEPEDINRTVLKNYEKQQWVYGSIRNRQYIYFENGKVTSWQD